MQLLPFFLESKIGNSLVMTIDCQGALLAAWHEDWPQPLPNQVCVFLIEGLSMPWSRWKPWRSCSSDPIESWNLVIAFCVYLEFCTLSILIEPFIVFVLPSAFLAHNSAKMAEFKKGRLKQVDNNPDLLDRYVKAWGLFPALKQASLCLPRTL